MSLPPKIYCAADILKARRALKKVEKPVEAKNSNDPQPAERPEGPEGLVFDALQTVSKVEEAIGKIQQRLEELKAENEKSLDSSLSDEDRKPLNKKFQFLKNEINSIANSPIDGDSMLSGKYDQKPRIFTFGEGDENKISVRIASLSPEGLGIHRARIESLPSAKKAKEQINRGEIDLKEVTDLIATKISNLSLKKRTFEENRKVEEQLHKKRHEQISALTGTADFHVLREKQERAAEAKGRTVALLVNIKV